MYTSKDKEALCIQHHDLLYMIHRFGDDSMLLPQLRVLSKRVGMYSSDQALGRAVRTLKNAGILKRMTWIDGRSDLLIGCKFMFQFLAGASSSQEVSAARKYNSLRPYMAQSCKVDYLIRLLEHNPKLKTLADVERVLYDSRSTLFLRIPELIDYFSDSPFNAYNKTEYNGQFMELKRLAALRSRFNERSAEASPSPLIPVLTLETLHRRGIYITSIGRDMVALIWYDYTNSLTASRIMDCALDAHSILHPLLPNREIRFCIQTLDKPGAGSLKAQLTATRRGLPYHKYRLYSHHINGGISLFVQNSDFRDRWMGGVYVSL